MKLLVRLGILFCFVNLRGRAEDRGASTSTSTEDGLGEFGTTTFRENISDAMNETDIFQVQPRVECNSNCRRKKDSFGRTYRHIICSPDKSKCTGSPINQCLADHNGNGKCSSCIGLGGDCSTGGAPCCTPWYFQEGQGDIPATPTCLGNKCMTSCFATDCINNEIPCCESASNTNVLCRHYGGERNTDGKFHEHPSLCTKDWCGYKSELLGRTVNDLVIQNHIHIYPPFCRVNGLGEKTVDVKTRCDCPLDPLKSKKHFECRKKQCLTCGAKDAPCTKGGTECCKEFKCSRKKCTKK